jgi:hypothetical protein
MTRTEFPALAERTRALLAAGVPLTLLIDLVSLDGPSSRELYAVEGQPPAWLPVQRRQVAARLAPTA